MANKYTKTIVDVNRIVELYNSGMTQKEVAEEMGLTQKIVWHRLRESNIHCRKDAPRNQKGSLNNNWKESGVCYTAFHYRIKSLRGKPKKCEVCGTENPKKTYDWANLTGQYDNPDDYKRMCRSCHWKHDKKHMNFKGATGARKGVSHA